MAERKASRAHKPYHHGDLRNALLAAAGEVLAAHGVEALSLREVAQLAGVSHAAAYRHFESKEVLLAALAEHGFRDLAATTRAAVQAHPGDEIAQLQASGEAYVAFGVRNPQRLRLMFSGLIADWNAHPGLAEASTEAFDVLVGIVRAGQSAGRLRAGDPMALAVTAWSLVHGLATLLAGKRIAHGATDPSFSATMARQCCRLQIEGLAAAR